MDRRTFLAMGGVAAVTGATAAGAHETGYPHEHLPDGTEVPAGHLMMRRIPSTGETIPAVGLGTSGPFEVGADDSARAPLREVLRTFFEAGATLIDTSPMYSTAESVLGDLLKPEQQAKVFIATKVWTPGSGNVAEQKGVEQMQRSMALLKHPRVELMQVHNLVDLEPHLKTLRRWKAEGRIKYIGNRAYEDGNQFGKVAGKPLPPWAAEFGATSWAQVFLKFVLAHPAVTCVIPATGKARNVVDNLGAALGKLPDGKQRAQIVSAVA
jgi:aryl-alcohol dehydrogenase-like predicted oxidoreductase